MEAGEEGARVAEVAGGGDGAGGEEPGDGEGVGGEAGGDDEGVDAPELGCGGEGGEAAGEVGTVEEL